MRYAPVLLSMLLAGCVTGSYDPPVCYLLAPEYEVGKVEPTGESLAIRPLDPARPYRQNIVYRDGLQIGQYVTAEWAELPGDVVTRTLADALRDTGRFADVGFAPDVNQPDYTLTGSVRAFELRRDTDPWTAVCEIRVEVRRTLGQEVLYAHTVSRSVSLESNELSTLPAAMSEAVGKIVTEAANNIASR